MKKLLITIFVAILIVISFNAKTSAWEIENNELISSNILNLNYNEVYLIDTTENDYISFNNPNIEFVKLNSGVYLPYNFKNSNRNFGIIYTNNETNIKQFYLEGFTPGMNNTKIAFLIELKEYLNYKENLEYIFNFYTFNEPIDNTIINSLSIQGASFDKNSKEIGGLFNNGDGYVFYNNQPVESVVIENNNIFCNNIDSFCYTSGISGNFNDNLYNLNEINCVIISLEFKDDFFIDFNLEIKNDVNNDFYFTPYDLKYNDVNTSKQNQDLIKVFDTNNYFIESEYIQVLNSEDYSILNGYVAIKDKGTKSININYLAPPTINGSLENFSNVFVFAFKNVGFNSEPGVLSINGSESRYIDNYVYTFIDLGEYTSDFQLPYMNFNLTSTNFSNAKVIFGILVSPQFFNLNYVPQEQKYHINDSAVKTFLTSLENSFNTDVDSYNNGVNYGYNQGFNEGVNSGYSDGFKVGYEEGAKEGYHNGLNNSSGNAWKNVWDFIYNIFTFIGKFMDIELVAGVKVGYIVTFIISLSLISFLIHVFKGWFLMQINPFVAIFDFFKFFYDNCYNFLKALFTPVIDLISNNFIKTSLRIILKPLGLEKISIMTVITTGFVLFLIIKLVKEIKL